jgi:alpha-L-fucosidase 2
MISANKTPELAEAAKVSLNMRDEGFVRPIWPVTGGNWSMAWRAACWARLHDGERAIRIFNMLNKDNGYENLMNNQVGYMQVDASMATPGIFSEMLLQSEDDNLYLLPALPSEWPEGAIKGLIAKGGYVINMAWEYGQLAKVELSIPQGAKIPILYVKGKRLSEKDKKVKLSYTNIPFCVR